MPTARMNFLGRVTVFALVGLYARETAGGAMTTGLAETRGFTFTRSRAVFFDTQITNSLRRMARPRVRRSTSVANQ